MRHRKAHAASKSREPSSTCRSCSAPASRHISAGVGMGKSGTAPATPAPALARAPAPDPPSGSPPQPLLRSVSGAAAAAAEEEEEEDEDEERGGAAPVPLARAAPAAAVAPAPVPGAAVMRGEDDEDGGTTTARDRPCAPVVALITLLCREPIFIFNSCSILSWFLFRMLLMLVTPRAGGKRVLRVSPGGSLTHARRSRFGSESSPLPASPCV